MMKQLKTVSVSVQFDKNNIHIIPYLMEALNSKFNIIRFKGSTDYIYALTEVDSVKETFNYKEFDALNGLYTDFIMIFKKLIKRNIINIKIESKIQEK